MKNADLPAMPMFSHEAKPCEIRDVDTGKTGFAAGLTKREMLAMHFMASWINHHGSAHDYGFSAKGAAESAIECADALLAKLDETKS